MSERQIVVIGAGQSGLSAALSLKDVGLDPLVLERTDAVASAWRGRYDRLKLNTWRAHSHLPDRPFPKGTPTFPSRDQVVQHLERHAAEEGLEFRFGTEVGRIDRDGGRWLVTTREGEVRSPQVVVATGYENDPFIPDWPGRDRFDGELLHARDYRRPAPYAGKRVLVVGPGCTGMEIAFDLAEAGAGKVWLAARTPPNILLRQGPAGVPGDVIGSALLHTPVRFADWFANFGRRMDVGDLTEHGLPVPEEGVFSRMYRLGVAPAIIDKEILGAIKSGAIEIVRGVESLDPRTVALADGTTVEPDAIICATGYRRGLEPLVGHLDVLGERGVPRALGPKPAAPGLRFIGYVPRPGGLGYMAKEAKRAAKAIKGELASAPVAA
jgi:cation diffusion facilitator CzcD-associated flavoprotein CzcO